MAENDENTLEILINILSTLKLITARCDAETERLERIERFLALDDSFEAIDRKLPEGLIK